MNESLEQPKVIDTDIVMPKLTELEQAQMDAMCASDALEMMQMERDELQRQLSDVTAQRDAYWVEYEIRAKWIKHMNDILGYNNDDGFHSEPDPFTIARNLKRQLAAEREARETAEGFIERQGYRRCDIAACNCNSWHGGHAGDRLCEIKDTLEEHRDLNGKTILDGVSELLKEVERLREELKEALLPRLEEVQHIYCQQNLAEARAKLALATDALRYLFYYRLPTGEKVEDILIRDEEPRWTTIHAQLTTGKDVNHDG